MQGSYLYWDLVNKTAKASRKREANRTEMIRFARTQSAQINALLVS